MRGISYDIHFWGLKCSVVGKTLVVIISSNVCSTCREKMNNPTDIESLCLPSFSDPWRVRGKVGQDRLQAH